MIIIIVNKVILVIIMLILIVIVPLPRTIPEDVIQAENGQLSLPPSSRAIRVKQCLSISSAVPSSPTHGVMRPRRKCLRAWLSQ